MDTSKEDSMGDSVPPSKPKYTSRLTEAKACVAKAKTHLGNSRNLKTDIKVEVTQAIDRLFELVKEAEGAQTRGKTDLTKETQVEKHIGLSTAPQTSPDNKLMESLMVSIKEHSQLVAECKIHTTALTDQLKLLPSQTTATEHGRATYAQVASSSKKHVTQVHSIVVTSGEGETSGEVVQKIRTAVDAKTTGIRVERVRKAKDQKVIVGCDSREELARVSDRIRGSGIGLHVEEVKNKDPLVILRDVLSYNSDEDIVAALVKQNANLLGDLRPEELVMGVKYRRKTRNPHTSHIVVRVTPQAWQRLTAAERVHIDLQRVRVADQSPLVQCSLCLGYGHGRRFCTESITKCSHCGGPHMWDECAERLANAPPTCCNCVLAKHAATEHNAFSQDCPVRRKWDILARSSVAYC